MNPKKLFFTLAIYTGMLVSCTDNNKEDKYAEFQTIFIDNSNLRNVADVSLNIEKIEIVPLKEEQGNLLADATKVYVSKNHYIVFDRFGSHKIGLFDSKGHFIKTVIKTGEGPADALQINDCWLNNQKELEVYDFAQKKIYTFDTAFNLKKIMKFPEFIIFNTLKSLPNSNKYIGYAGFDGFIPPFKGNLYHIGVLDKSLNLKNAFNYYDKSFAGIQWLTYLENFYLCKDTLRFVEPYDNYVYNASESGISKRYKIEYKTNPLPDDIVGKTLSKNSEKLKDKSLFVPTKELIKGYTSFNGKWLESDRFIFITSIDEKNGLFFSLFDKNKNNIVQNARLFADNSEYKTLIPDPMYYDAENDWFISVIKCHDLKKLCLQESSLYENIDTGDDETLYIFKVRFK